LGFRVTRRGGWRGGGRRTVESAMHALQRHDFTDRLPPHARPHPRCETLHVKAIMIQAQTATKPATGSDGNMQEARLLHDTTASFDENILPSSSRVGTPPTHTYLPNINNNTRTHTHTRMMKTFSLPDEKILPSNTRVGTPPTHTYLPNITTLEWAPLPHTLTFQI